MKRQLSIASTALLLASFGIVFAADAGTSAAPTHIKSMINLRLELHNFLMVESEASETSHPEYTTEINSYRQAREMARDLRVWRIINDALVVGPDMPAVVRRADTLPSDLPGPDREAARKVLGALGTAWSRFESHDATDRNRSLQNILVRVLRKQFGVGMEERVMSALYSTMDFRPLDAPITVFPVINAVEVGVWGKTPDGYYLVVPVARRRNMQIIEGLVHELTHIIDANQPPGSSSVLARLREVGKTADPEELAAFAHGLVAWNAGEMIRRSVSESYTPLVAVSPSLAAAIRPYLPTYEGPWKGYLDGHLSADEAVSAMVASLKPATSASGG